MWLPHKRVVIVHFMRYFFLFLGFSFIASFIVPNNFNESHRTAVLISGELRSGNMTWRHKMLRRNQALAMFGVEDPPTPIETIIQWLFEIIISQGGGLDVFYYVQAHPGHNNSDWDGDPARYDAEIGDLRVCEPFKNHGLFNDTGNRFFCLVEPEIQLLTPMVNSNPSWNTYGYGKIIPAREQLLQQLYGMFRSNLASKQYAIASGINYKYKMRVRPDIALVRPFVKYNDLNFNKDMDGCATIVYPNKAIMRGGGEDSFNVGYTEDMDHVLDRYLDFISLPNSVGYSSNWTAETYLINSMRNLYNICFTWNPGIWMVPIRSNAVTHISRTPVSQLWRPTAIENQWIEVGNLSTL